MDKAATPTGYTLHSDLAELESCTSCDTCVSIYDSICNMQYEVNALLPLETLSKYKAVLLFGENEPGNSQRCTIDGSLGLFVYSLTQDEKVFVKPWRKIWVKHHELGGGIKGSRILSPPQNTGSAESLSKARFWLDRCITNHCPGNTVSRASFSGKPPRRLVEIVDFLAGTLRLVEGGQTRKTYTALSYTWGSGPSKWKTTQANKASRMEQFHMNELPPTLADAVRISVGIGIPYIWIDSLCIVQDDTKDWEIEASNMMHVYTNAIVTIAADSSENSMSGIFNTRSRNHFEGWQPHLTWRGSFRGCQCVLSIDAIGPWSHWFQYVNKGYPRSRGWCCQESLLSPRILHFTETQLLWECLHCLESEDNFNDPGLNDRTQGVRRFLLTKGQTPTSVSSLRSAIIRHWYFDIIKVDYSTRALTNASDKLIAIAGIAKAIHQMCDLRYCAGIWDFRIAEGLAWSRGWNQPGGKAKTYRSPSWSWASQDSNIAYFMLDDEDGGSSVVYSAQRIDIDVRTSTADDFGLVLSASLTMRSTAVKGLCVRWEEGLPTDRRTSKKIPRTRVQLSGVTIAGVELLARMDNEADEECERDVIVFYLLQYREEPYIVFLLLALSDEAENRWQRVGQAEPVFSDTNRANKRQLLLDEFEGPQQDFTIV